MIDGPRLQGLCCRAQLIALSCSLLLYLSPSLPSRSSRRPRRPPLPSDPAVRRVTGVTDAPPPPGGRVDAEESVPEVETQFHIQAQVVL